MNWYNSDYFDGELTIMMYKKGIIKEGSPEGIKGDCLEEQLIKMESSGEIEWIEKIIHHKDYNVIKRSWRFIDKEKINGYC